MAPKKKWWDSPTFTCPECGRESRITLRGNAAKIDEVALIINKRIENGQQLCDLSKCRERKN